MDLLGRVKSLFGAGRVDVSARFELLREAVHGTMSNFFMARDRRTDQIVGLKILDERKRAAYENRFTGLKKPTEGEIALSLVHPAIVKTLEHGLTTAGEHYIVMEYLEGHGLNSFIQTCSPQIDGRRMFLLRRAAEATAAVHDAGYIYHDICPRNFVVGKRLDWLKLIDFGLTVPAAAAFMKPGNRTGTPKFMAPEVVRRRSKDQRLDVFSFGVTAYNLFTSEFPWPGGSTGKDAMDHATRPPVDIVELRPSIDRTLARAIHQCLEAKPDDRPGSLKDFLKMIEKVEREDEA